MSLFPVIHSLTTSIFRIIARSARTKSVRMEVCKLLVSGGDEAYGVIFLKNILYPTHYFNDKLYLMHVVQKLNYLHCL